MPLKNPAPSVADETVALLEAINTTAAELTPLFKKLAKLDIGTYDSFLDIFGESLHELGIPGAIGEAAEYLIDNPLEADPEDTE